jgi:hypothetical protein
MPFSFRNRITLTHGTRFSSDQSQVKLSAEGATENVLLQTPSREGKIGDATELVLSGGGYSSFEEAEQAGRRWRQHLMIAMARFGVGGDFGTATDVEARRGHGVVGQMFYQDRPGLQVLEYPPDPRFMEVTTAGTVGKTLQEFLAGPLHAELKKPYVPQSDSHELAYSLVHTARFESNPETVHVVLVTALEAIIAKRHQPRAKPVKQILDEFKDAVKQRFSKADANRQLLLSALGNAKNEGINECGQRVASEVLSKDYGGERPGVFFKTVYDQRNAIVHGRTPEDGRPTTQQLVERRASLFAFVLDLLAADVGQDAERTG